VIERIGLWLDRATEALEKETNNLERGVVTPRAYNWFIKGVSAISAFALFAIWLILRS
jgi:hypothetical protein